MARPNGRASHSVSACCAAKGSRRATGVTLVHARRRAPVRLECPKQELSMYRTLLACLVGLACAQAQAAEVKVLTTGAMKAVVLELVPQFAKESGHKVLVDNDTAGGVTRRVEGGE